MTFHHPLRMYLIVSDREPNKVLSSATSVKKAKELRKQFADSMGQGAPVVRVLKVEECTEV